MKNKPTGIASLAMSSVRNGAARTVFAVLIGGYSVLGWCPPPPGAFLPDRVTYDLGQVEVGSSAEVSISFLLNPIFSDPSFGVFSISPSTFQLFNNQENSFAVDAQRTTCIPGAIVTATTGCTVTIRFMPTSTGRKTLGELWLNECQSIFTPCPPNMGIGSILTFTGLGLATPVPTLSQFAVLSLTMFVIALSWWRQHRAKGYVA
jgi:hypothetical protein